jgi:hypothetical protein
MATVTWNSPASIATALSTELNSLADGSRALSAAIDNETNLARFLDLELLVAAQGSARDDTAHVEMHILYSIDGTHYSFGDASINPSAAAPVAVFALDGSTNERYVALAGIPIAPLKFKLLLVNQTGQAFASSGSTLKQRTHNEKIA